MLCSNTIRKILAILPLFFIYLNGQNQNQSLSQNTSFNCYSCQGGFKTTCAIVLPEGMWESCSGKNAQCYEAIVHFQNGAAQYVERRCWVPPTGSNATDFCKSFNNPNGKLIYCKSCKTNECNGHPYNPNNQNGTKGYFLKTNCSYNRRFRNHKRRGHFK